MTSTAVAPHSSGGVLPPCRHLRVNLGDPALVKHTLDEQAAMVRHTAVASVLCSVFDLSADLFVLLSPLLLSRSTCSTKATLRT